MRIRNRHVALGFTTALLAFLLACESTEKKPAVTTPPAQATAPTLTASAPPPPPKVEPPAHPKVDPVEDVLRQVEREYTSGQAMYTAGHLEAAKDSFDRAFNLLLQGPVAVRSDERLRREFDKIVEGVQRLEILALKQG